MELLTAVLLELDLEPALRFSHANNCAKSLIASIWEYRKVRELAPQCLYAAFRTGLLFLSSLGVSALYAALVTKGCGLCGRRRAFARFFSLLTATQCCLLCLEEAPECAILCLGRVCRATGRSPGSVRRRVPVLPSMPGSYGWQDEAHTQERLRGPGALFSVPGGALSRASASLLFVDGVSGRQRYSVSFLFVIGASTREVYGGVEHTVSRRRNRLGQEMSLEQRLPGGMG